MRFQSIDDLFKPPLEDYWGRSQWWHDPSCRLFPHDPVAEKLKEMGHPAYEKLEKAYLKKEDYDHIEQIYREVLGKRPEDFTTRLILSEYYQKKGLSHKAVQELREAIKFKPKSLTIRKKLGEILLKEDLKDAIRTEYQALIEEMKGQRVYSCNKCGYQSIDFIWKCPQCKEWDTFVEEDA